MLPRNLLPGSARIALLCVCLIAACSVRVYAQTGETHEQLKQRAITLIDAIRYTEALPLVEKIVLAEPDNPEMHFYLGVALQGQASQMTDDATRKSLWLRARAAFVKAKDLGAKDPIIDAFIQGIPEDGNVTRIFSPNVKANTLMLVAESKFAQGKLEDALKDYQEALSLDPKLYFAALFSGDVFTHREDFAQAEVWYQKAIAINPMIETAYRYSATPLMKQGKTREAGDRYIEAFITEPGSRFAVGGLTRWAQATNSTLAHPDIVIPTSVSFDEKGDANINLDASALMGKDDGSFAWLAYGGTRSTWRKEKFAKTFPKEAKYRHSLAEEADALRSVLSIASTDKKIKKLSPSLAQLKKLNDDGLLEAYILLARPDQGIVKDYQDYLKANRAKLIRYMKEYVVTSGGN